MRIIKLYVISRLYSDVALMFVRLLIIFRMPILNSGDRPLPSNGFFDEDGNETRAAPPGLVIPAPRPPLELRQLVGLEAVITRLDQTRLELKALVTAHLRDTTEKMDQTRLELTAMVTGHLRDTAEKMSAVER